MNEYSPCMFPYRDMWLRIATLQSALWAQGLDKETSIY